MASHHVFFAFAAGLSGPISVPKGTVAKAMNQIAETERLLGLETEQYEKNPPHWKSSTPSEEIDDKIACKTADEHNRWVRWFYGRLGEWSKSPVKDGEKLTPEIAAKFWHGLQMVQVPPERWTGEYYRGRMDYLYEVMRGRESEGATFDAKPLTREQADSVISLFSEYLDTHDMRLAVPVGYDCLRASYDGGYSWCEKCGAIAEEDVEDKIDNCRKRGGCPIRRDYGDSE